MRSCFPLGGAALGAATVLFFVGVLPLSAQNNWSEWLGNANDGNWFNEKNWDGGVPTAESNVLFLSGGEISFAGVDSSVQSLTIFKDYYLENDTSGPVVLTVDGAQLTILAGVEVGGGKEGDASGGLITGSEGTLRIENGGTVVVGGMMTVGGAGADDYSGHLVLDGGTLQSLGTFSCGSATVMGTVTLSNGAVWEGGEVVTLGAESSLTVESGSVVRVAAETTLNGGVSVSGIGSALRVIGAENDLLLGVETSVTNGAELSVEGNLSAPGTILFDGASVNVGGEMTAGAFAIKGGSVVNAYTLFSANVEMRDATVTLTGGGGVNEGGSGTLESVTWTMGAGLNVSSKATLTIGKNAKVSSGGLQSTIRGDVTVAGSGAEWTHQGGSIYITDALSGEGDGSLLIENGGVVRVFSSEGHGSVNVSSGYQKGTLHVAQGGTLIADYINASSGTAEVRVEGNLELKWIQAGRSGGEGTKRVIFDGGHWKVATGGAAKCEILEHRVSETRGGFEAGEIILAKGGLTVETEAGFTAIISAVLVGEGGITKTGAGDLLLSGENQFTGTVTVNEGKLILDEKAVNNLVTIVVDGEGLLEINNSISLSGLIADGVALAEGEYNLSAGDLLAYGVSGNGMLTIIPEPSTYALLGGALALGLAGGLRRRRKTAAGHFCSL